MSYEEGSHGDNGTTAERLGSNRREQAQALLEKVEEKLHGRDFNQKDDDRLDAAIEIIANPDASDTELEKVFHGLWTFLNELDTRSPAATVKQNGGKHAIGLMLIAED